MPYTLDAAGKLVWVEGTPDRVTPAKKPAGDGSTIIPELEQRAPGAPAERVVQLIDPNGGIFEVGESGVATALEGGRFQLATPEEVQRFDTRAEREGALESLKAFGEGAGAAVLDVVAGAGNLVRAASGEENAKQLEREGLATGRKFQSLILGGPDEEKRAEYEAAARQRIEDHGFASGAGSLTGTALTALVPGGVAAKGATALGAGRALAGAAAGVTEGALAGFTEASEDAFFENKDLTSEQMIAAMGWGALIGGGVGLGVGKAQDLLFSRAGSRGATPFDSPRAPAQAAREATEGGFSERFAETLRGFSEERVTKALGARGTDIRKLGRTAPKAEAEMRRMARDVLEGTLEDGTPIFRAVQSQDELVGNLVQAREEAGRALGAFRERVGSYIDETATDLRPKPAAIAERIEKEVIAELEGSPIPQVRAKARAVRGVVEGLRGMGDDVSLAQITKAKQELSSVIYPKAPGPGLPPAPPAAALELQRAERILEENIEATIDKATAKMSGGVELGKYGELKAKFRSYREAAQIAGKADLQDLGNRIASPTDYGVGAVAATLTGGAGLGAAVTGAAAAAVHKTLREHSSAVFAVLADRLAKRVDRRVTKGIDSFFERALGPAARIGPANENAVKSLPAAKTKRPTPAVAAAAVATPMALFLGKDRDKQKAYQKRAREVLDANAEYGTRVRARVEETLGELGPKAPKLAASMVTKATKGAQFLASKLPAPVVNARSFTPSKTLPVSDVEISKFAKYWSAVSSPVSVLDDLRLGRLSPEQVEALQVVYPELYRTIVVKVTERLGELDRKGTFIPYRARLELDLLLKMNGSGEPTASPARVALFQEIRATTANPEQADRPAPPAKPVNLASHLRSGRDAIDPAAGAQP